MEAEPANNLATGEQLARRLNDLVRLRNRELKADALLKASLGLFFSFVTFGFLFCIGWFVGVAVGRTVGLYAWQVGVILSGVFFVAATWSAWQRVNPLADLRPLSDRELMLTVISQATPGMLYFSPRHALAGTAVILMGGPAAVIEALGIWAHRLRVDPSLVEDAADLLASCETAFPVEQVRKPAAAMLLRRLALITTVPKGDSVALVLTEKGSKVLSGGRKRKRAGKDGQTT